MTWTSDLFANAWPAEETAAHLLVIFNVVAALLLGLLVGYERSYHGRAAGMRTYGLVCMASAAITVIAGYPGFWFGGNHLFDTVPDPTRIMQGIVTGVGFLCAGVIMKEGFSISGLTTAASIWATSVIGIVVGVGFYGAAIALAVLCTVAMLGGSWVEGWLPSHQALAIVLRFRVGFVPQEEVIRRATQKWGYDIAGGTMAINCMGGSPEWRFVAVSLRKRNGASLSELAAELTGFEGVESFQISQARN
ncbi:MAG: putative rane protein [Proteobacteria bacterium]|nr:putative rane protein [Pseudomonadota bacterium]